MKWNKRSEKGTWSLFSPLQNEGYRSLRSHYLKENLQGFLAELAEIKWILLRKKGIKNPTRLRLLILRNMEWMCDSS